MSLSKNHLKLITSLRQKKYRQKHKMFVVEGVKVNRCMFLRKSVPPSTVRMKDGGTKRDVRFDIISSATIQRIKREKVVMMKHLQRESGETGKRIAVNRDSIHRAVNVEEEGGC